MNQPLSTATLRSLLSLTEKREKLLVELSAIEAKISAALDGTSVASAKPSHRRGGEVGNTRSGKPAKRSGKRGKIKDLILEALKEAGTNGISVKELSAKLGLKNQNVHVWFATTGKKLAEKAGPGVYRLKKSGGAIEKLVSSEKPGKTESAKKGKRKPSAPKTKLTGKK